MLEVRVLGPIEARTDHDAARIGSPTQRLVLAALACEVGRPVSVDRLTALVWDDDPPDDPKASLKSHVSRLRGVLSRDVIVARGGGYTLTIPPRRVDAHRFEARAADADTVEQLDDALQLWRGEPYGEFGDRPFFAADRRRLTELHANARQRRAELVAAAGRPDEAAAALQALVAERPLREPAWIALLEALTTAGRQPAAVAAARRYREHVADAGLAPSPRFVAVEEEVFATGHGGDGHADGGGGQRVPARVASVIGRDTELEELATLLADRRIVTLVGPGGVGKTTLAVELARAVEGDLTEHAWVARLADVEDADAVVPTIARAVGAPTTDPIDRAVRDFLSGRDAVLVLDDAEHVHTAVRRATGELASAAPDLRLLVTSRRPLGLPGEVVYEVEPLAREAAVTLFRERAEDAGAPVTSERTDLVVEICDRLDRLPLALEMAAGRLRGLGLEDLAARLDRRLGLLHSGTGEAGRHGTLREVVAWSYELLDEPARSLLAQLSVFAGPFGLPAAEEVCVVDGDVAAGLAGLVDRSLVRTVTDGDRVRYVLLETIRQFAAERLGARVDRDGVIWRFVHHHVSVIERIEEGLRGPDEVLWARRFRDRMPNLEAAHGHALAGDDLDAAARLAAAPYLLVYQRLRADVGAWAETTLPAVADRDHPLTSAVRAVAAVNHLHRGELAEAGALLGDLPDDPAARHGHEVLADLALYRGDLEGARKHARRAAELAEAAGDAFTALFAVISRALALGYAGRLDRARSLLERGRDVAEEHGSPLLSAWFDYAEGELLAGDDPAGALTLLDRAVAAADEAGWSLLAGVGRLTAGSVRARTSDATDALPAFERLLRHWDGLGDRTHQWTTLRNIVELLTRLEAHRAAARLLGAVSTAPTPTYGPEADRLEASAERLRGHLGDDVLEEARQAGREMDHDDAVELALTALARLRGEGRPEGG